MTVSTKIVQNANGVWMLEGEQLWDTEVLNVALEHIKEGDTVIDAGAWIGGHTMAYAEKVGVSGQVYAFEPNPEAFGCLKKNTDTFTNTHCSNTALGDECRSVELCIKKGWQDSAYVEAKNPGTIPMVPMDIHELAPNFIKIDVEGCELKVLKGASKTIEKYRPVMCIEINKPALERQGNSQPEVYEWLWKNGYDFTIIERDADLHAPIYNILAIHA